MFWPFSFSFYFGGYACVFGANAVVYFVGFLVSAFMVFLVRLVTVFDLPMRLCLGGCPVVCDRLVFRWRLCQLSDVVCGFDRGKLLYCWPLGCLYLAVD